MRFRRSSRPGPPSFTPVPCTSTPRLLIVNSGAGHSTRSIVEQVRAAKDSLGRVFSRIGEIVEGAERCLGEGRDLGDLITENNNLLNKLPGVNNPHTDRIVQICSDYGVSAKITGAGGGGVVIGLLRDGVDGASLVRALENAGFKTLTDIKMGVPGVGTVEKWC